MGPGITPQGSARIILATVSLLFPRHPQLEDHPLIAFVVDQVMAMEENATVLLKVCARHGLAPGMFGIEGRGPQYDIFPVKRAVTLANRHRGLPRVVPHRGEAIGFGIEAGDSGAGALGSVSIEEGEIRLKKLPILDHVLFARAFCHDRLPVPGEESLDHVPFARKLRKQLLAGARRVRGLVLIVGLLCNRRSGHQHDCKNAISHGAHGTR